MVSSEFRLRDVDEGAPGRSSATNSIRKGAMHMTTKELLELDDDQLAIEIDKQCQQNSKRHEEMFKQLTEVKSALNAFEEKAGRLPAQRSGQVVPQARRLFKTTSS
jgi:3-methyladenine DNA glycosylase/8-oxoguanine DNA glycosylase